MQQTPFPFVQVSPQEANTSHQIGEVFNDVVVDNSNSIIGILLEAIGFPLPASYGDEPASAYVRDVVNYFLGLVSFIAVIVLIYGFYGMFFAEQEKGFNKAKQMVRGTAIALGILFLSWFIISYLFTVFTQVSVI
ncbi:MAG TPA: hypothetical protein PKC14_00180 [Candidatus Absconditabacterales bacterium]|nr:hypothetical protein [Candidatus Absconditabacterales bacterium]